jgi:hypothetical protein
MKTHFFTSSGLLASSLLATALTSCSGTSSDPKTLLKGDLNPPFNLSSITYQDGFILQWDISNTEKNLSGFNVYVAKTALADVQSKLTGAVAGKKLDKQQIRRCKDTKAVFEVFGFDPNEKYAQKDCDDFSEEEESTASKAVGAVSSINAASPENTLPENPTLNATTENGTALKTAKMMKCRSITSTDMYTENLFSVDIKKAIDVEGNQISTDLKQRVGKSIRCILGKNDTLSDGTTGFAPGFKYTAFVVAVEGDKAGKVSYTSNFIEDIPTPQFSPVIQLGESSAATIKIAESGSGDLQLETSSAVNAEADSVACSTDPSSQCRIGRSFIVPSSPGFATMAFVEDVQAGSERIFYVGESNRVYITPVNPRPNKINGKEAIYMPGDVAPKFSETTYFSAKNFEVYPGSMFYFAIKRSASEVFYGKTYVKTVSFEGDKKKIELLMTLQTKANEIYSSLVKPSPWMFENN